jgi:type VI secretion system FHA domain protein
MIRIEVTSYNGQPATQPLAGEFDELGGTIGRAEGSTLVLPDPKRYISRTHAKVVFRGGAYMLRDESSATPVMLNGKPLGYGHEAPLGDGDVVVIGSYTMRVSGGRGGAAAARTSGRDAAATPAARDDPLAVFGAPSPAADPFGDLIAPPPAASPRGADVAPRASAPPRNVEPVATRAGDAATPEIPEDFDPFAEPEPAPAKKEESTDPLGFGLGVRDPKLDDIFGLSPADGSDPMKPGSPFGEAGPASSGSPELDPMVAIGAVRAKRQPTAPAQRDDTPEIYGYIPLAPVRPEPPAASDEPLAAPSPGPPVMRPAAAPAADAALLQAFLAGAGIPELRIPDGLTPQFMTLLGRLFRESTQGTLDLLLARATAKRQLRSPVTTIVGKDNNPLKFSPSVEAAMGHLLAPQGRGFMEPAAALEDAYDDLRAHEFGFMAGMRAALEGALARFDPAVLERRLAQKSVLDALLPMNRQAKLWALFGELYAEISREAEDNFHSVFGAEFLKAYEDQIAKLDQEKHK